MRRIGLFPNYLAPKASQPHPQHRINPSPLRHLPIERPDQVWRAGVTSIPMRRGFLYLVAICGPLLPEHSG
jgi:putative transposase